MPTNLGIVISKTAQMTAKCTDMCSWNAVPSTLAYAVYRVEEQEKTLRVVKQIPLVPGVAGHSWIKARCILTGGSISLYKYIYLHIFHCVGVYIHIYIERERFPITAIAQPYLACVCQESFCRNTHTHTESFFDIHI